jgi:hypothetical protein
MSITRRLFLRNTAAGAAVAAAVAAPVIVEAMEADLRERLDAAIAELKAASNAIWPTADTWMVKIEASPSVPILITNYDRAWKTRGEVNVYIDDGSPLLADDATGTTAYADWEARRAQS